MVWARVNAYITPERENSRGETRWHAVAQQQRDRKVYYKTTTFFFFNLRVFIKE